MPYSLPTLFAWLLRLGLPLFFSTLAPLFSVPLLPLFGSVRFDEKLAFTVGYVQGLGFGLCGLWRYCPFKCACALFIPGPLREHSSYSFRRRFQFGCLRRWRVWIIITWPLVPIVCHACPPDLYPIYGLLPAASRSKKAKSNDYENLQSESLGRKTTKQKNRNANQALS
jgi:hypothetical protein